MTRGPLRGELVEFSNIFFSRKAHRLDPGTISRRGTEPRLRDLWVVVFNPQSSLGVV